MTSCYGVCCWSRGSGSTTSFGGGGSGGGEDFVCTGKNLEVFGSPLFLCEINLVVLLASGGVLLFWKVFRSGIAIYSRLTFRSSFD